MVFILLTGSRLFSQAILAYCLTSCVFTTHTIVNQATWYGWQTLCYGFLLTFLDPTVHKVQ